MKILMKYIIKSMIEKKSRTFLVIVAITLSAALFYVSNSIEAAAVDMNMKSTIEQVGNADIKIRSSKQSPSEFLNSAIAREKLSGQTDYIVDTLQSSAEYRIDPQHKQNINLYGVSLEDYNKLNTLYLLEKSNTSNFLGNQIIISQKTANKYNLKLGDKIEIIKNNIKKSFTLYAISSNRTLFLNEKDEFMVMMPYDTLSKLMATKSKPNTLYIKAAKTTSIEDLELLLQEIYPKYTVEKVIDMENYAMMLGMISSSLNFMTIFVMFISIFIIYTVFKVITLEKLPIIGTFRSVGADKKMINKVLLLETLFYGVVGGILACILGVLLLYGITYATMPPELMGFEKPEITINVALLTTTFILANLLCILSSMMPIFRVSKIPVKEIVLNNIASKYKKPTRGFKTGIAIVIISLTAVKIAPREYRLIADLLAMIATLVATVKIIPGATYYIGAILEKLFAVFGNVGVLASKNIRENKSVTNSITLISIGISCIFMIGVLSNCLSTEVLNVYGKLNFDAWFDINGLSQADIKKLKANGDIKDVYAFHELYFVDIDGTNEQIISIEGTSKKYIDYYNFEFSQDKNVLFDQLSEGRNIIIGSNLAKRLGIKDGDSLNLNFDEGSKPYTVIGTAQTLWQNGNLALVDDKYLKIDAKDSAGFTTLIKTNTEPQQVLLSLRNTFKARNISFTTVSEMCKDNQAGNAQMMGLIQGFSIIALVIGIFGVVNNLIISFIERQRALAVYKSIGMSKSQVIQMIFLEALAMGTIGGLIGIGAGIILIKIIPDLLLYAIKVTMPMHYDLSTLLSYIFAAITIIVLASISPAIKSSKLNIIEAIKFE